MKMLYITANVSVLSELIELLERVDAKSYQVIEKAWAKPLKGDKRFDNAVWPGYNFVINTQVEGDQFDSIIAEIKKMNNNIQNENELITWAGWNLDSFEL